MPGLNILSVAPMNAGDSSVSPPQPTPSQSFAQVQQHVSGQIQTPDPSAAGGSQNPPPPNSSASGQDQAPGSTQGSGRADAGAGDHQVSRSDEASSGNDQAKASDGGQQAAKQTGSGDHDTRKTDSNQTAGKADGKETTKGKAKSASGHVAETDKGKEQKSRDKTGDPTLTPQQLLAIAQHQAAERKTVSPGKLSAKAEGKAVISTGDADKAGTASAGKKVADKLDKVLQKALSQGAQSGKGKTGQEIAAHSKGAKGELTQQLRLQGFGGEGSSFHQVLSRAATGTGHAAQTAATSQPAGTPAAGLSQYSTSVDLPVQHARWGEQIAGKVTWLANQHIQVADIHVNPPDLGPVHVQMHLHNDQASVSMHSHHPGVRDLLEANGQKLKDMMQQGGLNLANFDVSSHGGQQQGQNQQQSSGGTGRSALGASSVVPSLEKEPVTGGSLTVGWRRLDLYA